MPFPNWKAASLAHPAETAGDQNTNEIPTAFSMGLSALYRAVALAEDEHALILALSPGKSTALRLYHIL